MKKTPIIASVVAVIAIVVLGIAGFKFEIFKPLYTPKSVLITDKFLFVSNNQITDPKNIQNVLKSLDPIFLRMIADETKMHYKIENWKLSVLPNSPEGKDWVHAVGEATTILGKIPREMIIVYDKKRNLIVDSRGLMLFKDYENYSPSDIETYTMLKMLPNQIRLKIKEWGYNDKYALRNGTAKGVGQVENNSPVTIKNLKGKVTYYDKQGTLINTDNVNILTYDELAPGEIRNFDWTTFNCPGADRARIKLVFDN